MTKINGYWTDENNNKWWSSFFTEQEAEKYSRTLIKCRNCINCIDCRGCVNCEDCFNCNDCIDCVNCFHCISCKDCEGCVECFHFTENPQRYATPKIGRRNDDTTIYWLDDNIQVVCGCFRGDLNQWEKAIKETHKDNEQYREDYLKQVEIVKAIIKMNDESYKEREEEWYF